MQTLNNYIYKQNSNINESVGLVIAIGLLAWGMTPYIASKFKSSSSNKEHGNLFNWFFHHDEYKLDKKEKELDKKEKQLRLKEREAELKKREDELKQNAIKSLLLAKLENDKEKDEKIKKSTNGIIKSFFSCFKGNKDLSAEQIEDNLKESLPSGMTLKDLSNEMEKSYNEVENNPKLQKEFEEKSSKISEKDIDDFKLDIENDSSDSVKKDEAGNILKLEEVTDPETGEKKKVITHTGPRGGKFYYPEGKPKTPEHKVYVARESLICHLKNYLID